MKQGSRGIAKVNLLVIAVQRDTLVKLCKPEQTKTHYAPKNI